MKPNFIKENGPQLKWNRYLIGRMFGYLIYRQKDFACPVKIHLPRHLWYYTGFYNNEKLILVDDYTVQETGLPQQCINCYVWGKQSLEELRELIYLHEMKGSQFFLLSMDDKEKFITGFWLCVHTPSWDKFNGVIDFYNQYCNF